MKKKAAAYQVSLSAVKKIHLANKGMAKIKLINPAQTNRRGLRSINKRVKITIKNKSCSFI